MTVIDTATDTDADVEDDAAFWDRIATTIFELRYEDGLSYRAIAEVVSGEGYDVSSETVRKFVAGDTRPEVTEALRARYADAPAGRPVVPDVELEGIFRAYHDERRSLSQIARDLGPGYDYSHVRRVLVGEGIYAEPTAELRDRFPAYAPRDGRGYRSPFDEAAIAKAFHLYFKDRVSLDTVRDETGIPRERFKALVAGEEHAKATRSLRRRYGSQIRPAHRTPRATRDQRPSWMKAGPAA